MAPTPTWIIAYQTSATEAYVPARPGKNNFGSSIAIELMRVLSNLSSQPFIAGICRAAREHFC
jgi:hypothetical protein